MTVISNYVHKQLIDETIFNALLAKIQNGTDTDVLLNSVITTDADCSITRNVAMASNPLLTIDEQNAAVAAPAVSIKSVNGFGSALKLQATNALEFSDGVNSINLFTPTLTSSCAFYLPSSDGSAGQVLSTDGAGKLSFVSQPTVITSHSGLSDLANDDHTQYFNLSGRAGGQMCTLSTPLGAYQRGLIIYTPNGVTHSGLSQMFYVANEDTSYSGSMVAMTNWGVGEILSADFHGGNYAGTAAPFNLSVSTAQNNSRPMFWFNASSGSSTSDVILATNAGTGTGFTVTQNGVLASGKHALYVYSNAVQVNSPLVKAHQDNASSTANVGEILNDGAGNGVRITGTADATQLYITTSGTGGTGGASAIAYFAVTERLQDYRRAIMLETTTSHASGQNGAGLFIYDNSANGYNGIAGWGMLKVQLAGGGSGDLADFICSTGTGRGLVIAGNTTGAPLVLISQAANPTGYNDVGALAVVAGKLKICTVAGTPGTWTVVGTQS